MTKMTLAGVNEPVSRMMDVTELMNYISLGRNGAMRFGEDAGAKVRYGKRVLL